MTRDGNMDGRRKARGGAPNHGIRAATTRGRPTGRSRASGQDTRRRILEAADSLFSTRGYEEVTIRDIAAAADADPALVIRYFGSKNGLFILVRQPDLQLTPAPCQPLTAQSVAHALVELSLAQGTRLLDVAAIGGPQASKLIQAQIETQLVLPLMDAFGLTSAGRGHIEAIAALVAGVSLLRRRIEAPGLLPLNADQLTELLTPAVQALLDTAPRRTGHLDDPPQLSGGTATPAG
jgi:AcrR family transcriptional regulator